MWTSCPKFVHKFQLLPAYIYGFVYLSIHMFQLENIWTDLDEIWYGLYAIGGYLKLVLTSL
jgi:hypothetical protein